jgi:hypothetical protein
MAEPQLCLLVSRFSIYFGLVNRGELEISLARLTAIFIFSSTRVADLTSQASGAISVPLCGFCPRGKVSRGAINQGCRFGR